MSYLSTLWSSLHVSKKKKGNKYKGIYCIFQPWKTIKVALRTDIKEIFECFKNCESFYSLNYFRSTIKM